MPGKWGLHTFYAKDRVIRAHLPPTALLNQTTSVSFLQRHQSVYIKPNMSHMGKGIIKVWGAKGKFRCVKVKGRAKQFRDVASAYRMIRKETASQPYIIQKTIDLAAIKGRPYDIRVMMMRNARNRWQYTGMLAKVAGKSSVITNVNRGGGYAVPVDAALSASLSLSKQRQQSLIRQFIQLSHRICNRFIGYKYSSQIGIDFAVDRQGRVWVIEVNFDYPSHELFARLTDKTMYRRIKAIRRSYLQARRTGKIKR